MTGKTKTVTWGCSTTDDPCTEAQKIQIYVQPKRRKIFRPATKYCPQTATVETDSIYRKAYRPLKVQCGKPPSTPAPDCWPKTDAGETIDSLTTHRTSFPKWPDAERTCPLVPGEHELVGDQGPMQAVTSQRHDYVSKSLSPADRSRAAGPVVHLGADCDPRCPMASATTTAAAYASSAATAGRRPSARPSTADRWTSAEGMAGETETSSSYRPWDPLSNWRYAPAAYRPPAETVTDCTVYKGSYRPPGVFRDPLPGERPPAVRFGYCAADVPVDDGADRGPFYPRAHDYNL